MQELVLYDEAGQKVATVVVPLRRESWGETTPEIIKWQNRYWSYQEETRSYLEGQFYEVPA